MLNRLSGVYRPEIDSLRAIAVLSVIFFHCDFSFFHGGYVGVDVFFVISGFLMGNILLGEIDNRTFRFSAFFLRRFNRIFPALIIVLLVTLVASLVILDLPAVISLSESSLASLLSVSNIYFGFSGGYFSENLSLAPLLHTWSLSVEEQFYIVFPLILILVSKFNNDRYALWISVCALVSFLLSIGFGESHPTVNFFGLPTRGWELLVGGLGSCFVRRNGISVNSGLWVLGLLLIFFSVMTFSSHDLWPGWLTLFPVIGTLVCLVSRPNDGLFFDVLTGSLLRRIGLISYSLYLWHQPVLAFGRYLLGASILTIWQLLPLFGVIVLLSTLSFKYIEQPFRSRERLRWQFFHSFLFVLIVSVVIGNGFVLSGRDSREQWMARELIQQGSVPFRNVDERKFVIHYLDMAVSHEPFNTVIVGSSRLMALDSEIVGDPALNLSVSSAQTEDLVALSVGAMSRANFSRLVLGVDPSMIMKDWPKYHQWKTYKGLYEIATDFEESNGVGDKLGKARAFIDAFSSSDPSRFQSWYENVNRPSLVNNTNESEIVTKRIAGGSLVYSQSYTEQNFEKTRRDVQTLALERLNDITMSSSELIKIFNLVDSFQDRGVAVEIVLSPYHPSLHSQFPSIKQHLDDLEARLKTEFESRKVVIRGSFSSVTVGCDSDQFFDAEHFSKNCMKNAFNHIP